MLLYLDCCCLNRPYDDLSQMRVRLEAEAVEWILEESRSGRFEIVTSDYLIFELGRNPDLVKRHHTLEMTRYSSLHVPASQSLSDRALKIQSLGMTPLDALHIAVAEEVRCDFLVTTDDRLLKKSARQQDYLMVKLLNPVDLVAFP
ncbi:PIN domain-containing protein [Luteolibacter yonseiensis]|uniref:PIN domain-containing protein n=1 Tax=Luteolibacter yonseiensis TaxID=1144680 RepID=A0A934QZL1_9BACT|nr:PIN domain-containing protein [Luteolibacter yonseiensis]MBK1814136.1 PIN domain-containing protein [Luteolibacter yonseiensis]